MVAPATFLLAERVAEVARRLGIETAVIGAAAFAVHHYVRATKDIDLATAVDPYTELRNLERELSALGLHVERRLPDDEDALGGLLRVWEHEDEDGDPLDPVEVVNFVNPHRRVRTPAVDAIKNAMPIDDASPLRYVRLADLVALKLYAGARRDLADVVDLLVRNPDADLDEIRTTCARYGFEATLEPLIAEASAT
jgi:predicted nucleotidyltransferase